MLPNKEDKAYFPSKSDFMSPEIDFLKAPFIMCAPAHVSAHTYLVQPFSDNPNSKLCT